MSNLERIVSIPQWARRAGLADDGRSIATARSFIAKGDGPPITQVKRRSRKAPVVIDGVRLADHERWLGERPWAKYLATLDPQEREKRASLALRLVGDPVYVARLYERYQRSRWPMQMSFERWLKRRQRIRDKGPRGQKRRAARQQREVA